MSVRAYGMVAVFALLLSIYTLSHSSKFHVVDEVSLFAVTESIVLRGGVDTNVIAWTQWVNSPGEVLGAFGSDGEVYSKKGPAPALLAAPWYLFLRTLAQWDISVGILQGTLLWNGLVTALTALVLWRLALRLGYDDRTGSGLAMLFGLGTIAWPYANQFFGEPLSALSLLGAFWGLHAWRQTQGVWWALLAGLCASVAVATVTAHVLLVVVLALYGFGGPLWKAVHSRLRDQAGGLGFSRGWLTGAAVFIVPLLCAGGLLMIYNVVRFGAPFDTGYHFDSGEGFSAPLHEGMWGLLVSPYRGLFWFTPLFFASVAAWPVFLRRHAAEAWVTIALSVVLIVLYSMWWMWWAGFAWGPRFLVPLSPFWILWLAPWLAQFIKQGDQWLHGFRRRRNGERLRLGFGPWLILILTPISVLVQIGAVVVNWVNYEIRLRDIFPTDWEDPLAFGPPAQSILDLGHSPVFGQWILIQENLAANTDLAWLWSGGNIQRLLLAVGGAVVVTLIAVLLQWWYALGQQDVAGGSPPGAERYLPSHVVRWLLPILPLLLVLVWLSETSRNPHYGDPEAGYRAIISEVCSMADGDDLLVTVAPFAYQIPMNWLGGECRVDLPIYGYAPSNMQQTEAVLAMERAIEQYNRVWMVTGGLPANDPDNSVERWLANRAYKANDRWYADFRLVDYATATQLRNAPMQPLDVVLVGEGTSQITVTGVRMPSMSRGPSGRGGVLPVEIHYRLHDENVHDLRWFVQLLRPEGFPVALLDTEPRDGYVGFSELPVNEEIVERAGLLLPENLPAGRYDLIAGLYNPALEDAPRLRTADGDDFIHLSTITVQ